MPSIPLICVSADALERASLSASQSAWAKANGFKGQTGKLLALPDDKGGIEAYLFGLGAKEGRSPLVLGLAAAALGPGRYRLAGEELDPTAAALAFRLGAYSFTRYRKGTERPELDLPEGADAAEIERLSTAAFIARDLVNTPANDLGPDALVDWVQAFCAERGITPKVIKGDDLVTQNFPMIHTVGRASA